VLKKEALAPAAARHTYTVKSPYHTAQNHCNILLKSQEEAAVCVKVNDNDELKKDFVAEIIPGEVSVYVCGGHCNISLEYCIAPQDANVDDSSVDGAAGCEQYEQVQ